MPDRVSDRTSVRDGDNTNSHQSETNHRILAEEHATANGGVNQRETLAANSAALVRAGHLPNVSINHQETTTQHGTLEAAQGAAASVPAEHGVLHALQESASDIAHGALNEITHHPLQVAEHVAEGLAAGVALTAIGVIAAPEVVTGLTVAGLAYGAYQTANFVGSWFHNTHVLSDESNHSAAEISDAHRDLQHLGGQATLTVASLAGTALSAPLEGTVTAAVQSARGAINLAAREVFPALAAPRAVPLLEGPRVSGLLEAPSAHPMLEAPGVAAAREAVLATGSAPVEASSAARTIEHSSLAVERAAITPAERTTSTAEQAALQESIARNQSIFSAARNRGEVVPSTKQFYAVHFERVGPGGRVVPTLENPAGVHVDEGGWVATRLNRDGSPNMENGMVNQWTPSPSQITRNYRVTENQLQNRNVIAFTRTGAPPVHMVRLDRPMDFQTQYGPMHADAGDYLANYDYNPTTGQPGVDFARVTARSYQDTYQPIQR